MSTSPESQESDNTNTSAIDDYFFGDSTSESESDCSSDEEDDNIENDDNTTTVNKPEDKPNIIVGIDLGTTNSCVAVWRNNNLEVIPDSYGHRTLPSAVAYTNITRYVGRDAKNQIELNPANTYYEVKRLIGRKFTDNTVQKDLPFLSYEVCESQDNKGVVMKSDLENRKPEYTPEEVSSVLLLEMRRMAENYLGQPVTEVVITVPAYFNDSQRQATKDAATIAGLDCIRVINEPTAAGLAYGLERLSRNKAAKKAIEDSVENNDKPKVDREDADDLNIVVYDLGGGTLDCSVLNIEEGSFEVLGSTGNTHLGGADFDNRLVTHCTNRFKKQHRIRKLEGMSSLSMQKLRRSCENAKKMLSELGKATIAVTNFYDNKDLFLQLTRQEFEQLCKDLLIMCLKSVKDVLELAELEIEDIDEIIMVGGATRMPAIRDNIKKFFLGKEPNCSVNPDEVVAAGAALQGYILANKLDPFSESVVLLDSTSLSLGVETLGTEGGNGIMTTIIPRNTTIPVTKKKRFTTAEDNDTFVNVKIFEGERSSTADNFKVGEFKLHGIEAAVRGIATIDIEFKIDSNGIISVTAEDMDNGDNKKSVVVTSNKGRLSKDDIKKLVKEASDNDREDRRDRERRQLSYEIEELCCNIKTNLANKEFKLKEKDHVMVTNDVNRLEEWLNEVHHSERTVKDFTKVIKRIKRRYGSLILRTNSDSSNEIKGGGGNSSSGRDDGGSGGGVSVHGDTEETVYEKIERAELSVDEDIDLEEIKDIRKTLTELCYSIFEMVNSDTLTIKHEHSNELKYYVDDVLLWMHVHENTSKAEYVAKIADVNKACDKLLEEYKDDSIFEVNNVTAQIKNKRNELEQLCYTIKSSLVSKIFTIDEEQHDQLSTVIDSALEWLLDIDIQNKKAELVETEDVSSVNESEYQEKIDQINTMCNDLYNKMVGINIVHDEFNLVGDKIDTTAKNNKGTSMADLLQQEQ